MSNSGVLRSVHRACTRILRSSYGVHCTHDIFRELGDLVVDLLSVCLDVMSPLANATPLHIEEDTLIDARGHLDAAFYHVELARTNESNHFGSFRVNIVAKELRFIIAHLQQVMQVIRSQSGLLTLSIVDSVISEVTARQFWRYSFGASTESVPWVLLRDKFDSSYDVGEKWLLDILKQHLVGHENSTVAIQQFEEFTAGHHGFYSAFQSVADPGMAVYCTGSVTDEPEAATLQPIILESLRGLPISQISCGGQHAAILTSDGHVYTWGRGAFGRLGHGNSDAVAKPRCVEALRSECSRVTCGFAFTAAVTRQGHLYTWGAGENGRLGLGDVKDRETPCLVQALYNVTVTDVFAGSVHTCVLDDTGSLYSFGKFEYTGHGGTEDVLHPTRLDFGNTTIKQASVGTGGYHTITLTAKGEVYTWGHNRVGQLGFSNNALVQRNYEGAFFAPRPQRLKSLANLDVVGVFAGWGHTAVVTSSGKVYICGRNLQGQLGLGEPTNFKRNERGHPYQSEFTEVTALRTKSVTSVGLGGEHSVYLCDDGDVYSVGNGVRGQLGLNNTSSCCYPTLMDSLATIKRPALQVACGSTCTLILCGRYQPKPLQKIAIEAIRTSDELMERINSGQMLIPTELLDCIRPNPQIEIS